MSLDELDYLLDSLTPVTPLQKAGSQKPVVRVLGHTPGKSLSVTGFRDVPEQYGSTFRLWDQDKPWAGVTQAQAARGVQVDNLASNAEPIALLRSELATKQDNFRLWHEPAPRQLQQCILQLRSDAADRERAMQAGLIWVPVLNHRLNGQVKGTDLESQAALIFDLGVVIHRELNGLRNEMSPCSADFELRLQDPRGITYRQTKIAAKSLLEPFSFDIGGEARTGTWTLQLRSDSGHVHDKTTIEVLSFSKPEVMLVDLTAKNRVPQDATTSIRIMAKYFFDEPVTSGKVTYSITPGDPSIPPFKNVEPSWKDKDGIISFPALVSRLGGYAWEVTVTDNDGRTGSVVGMYQVVSPSFKFDCTLNVTSSTAIAEDVSEKFSVIYPGSSSISVAVAVLDQHEEPVPNVRFSLDMEGQGEFWCFTAPPPETTGSSGRADVQLTFNSVSFDSAEPFVMIVSAVHNDERFVWRKVILIDPRNQYTLKFDKESYRPGDKVIASITLQRATNALAVAQTLAVDVVGQTIWEGASLQYDAAVTTKTYTFNAPTTREPIYLHLRPMLSAPPARFRIPIEVSPFYSSELKVATPPKVATGTEIPIKVTLPHEAESDGVAVAIIVDKRIKKHPDRDNTQRWRDKFRVDPVTKKEHCTHFYDVTEWEHCREAVKFQAMLCSVQWVGFAFLNPHHSGRVLLVSVSDTSALTVVRNQFLMSLLSPSKQTYDAVHMLGYLPGVEQGALFTVGSTVKTLSHPSMFTAPGVVATPPSSLRKALKGQLSFLTNNLITTPAKNPNRLRKLRDEIRSLMRDALASANKSLIDAMKAVRDWEDDYSATVVRQNFIEVATVSSAFRKGAKEISLSFGGSDAITTYDVFVFACSESQIAYGKNHTVVKNKYFTVTKNPAQMVLGDVSLLRTIVQNTGDAPMENVLLQLTLDRLRATLAEQTIAKVEPGASASVIWEILAEKVGDAKMELLMKSGGFTEISGFDTPLNVIPPGEPVVQRYSGIVDKLSGWKMNFVSDPRAAYTKLVASILPCIPLSGAIEGVESLSKYPYGCCEQTHSSTLPNYILYSYLLRTGSSNETLKAKALKQLSVGCQRLIDQYRCADGGFGSWGRGNSTVFHTGLVLSLLGLASIVTPIDKNVIEGASACLEKTRNADGSFSPSSLRHYPETRFDAISTTAHAFNTLCLAGHFHADTLQWLKANLLHRCEDTTAVALVLEGLTRLPQAERAKYTVFMRNLRRLLLLEQKSDGSWSASQTTLCSQVESTAYAIIALGRLLALERSAEIANATHDTTQAIARGLDYVIANHKGSGGWGSTRDTLYAAWAVAETSEIVWAAGVDSTYTVRLNGKEVKKWTLKTSERADDAAINTIYAMREFLLPSELLIESNEVTVECVNGRASAGVEVHSYFHASNSDAATALETAAGGAPYVPIGRLTTSWPTTRVVRGRTTTLAVRLYPSDEYTGVMLEIPIPAGMLLPSIDSVSCNYSDVKKEFNPSLKTVSVFFHSISSGHTVNVDVKLEPFICGDVTANPCRAYQMYEPDWLSVTPTTKLSIVSN